MSFYHSFIIKYLLKSYLLFNRVDVLPLLRLYQKIGVFAVNIFWSRIFPPDLTTVNIGCLPTSDTVWHNVDSSAFLQEHNTIRIDTAVEQSQTLMCYPERLFRGTLTFHYVFCNKCTNCICVKYFDSNFFSCMWIA